MTGLYVHIPFCARKCHYCDFVIATGVSGAGRSAFLDALEKEAAERAPELRGAALDTVYLGGGTPSQLESGEMERLFGILRRHFLVKPDAEITCEANPGDIDAVKAKTLKDLGINRISLGAQSFHDETLARLNRAHGSAETESSFGLLREAGFHNINLDLILSLPGEPWEKSRTSLERAAALDPEHVSIYELSVEKNTVFGDLKRKGRLELPPEEEQLEILSNAREFLKSRGWRHYELLNYAKPGYESRHNLLYWGNEDTLGLGPGAWSYIGGTRSRFSETYSGYMSKTAAGNWRPSERETLSEDKRQVESFLLALRLSEGVPEGLFASVVDRFQREIDELAGKGLLARESGRLRLTSRGQFLAETVFTELSC